MNYDASKIGVPYARVDRITIYYPTQANPSVGIAQIMAMKAQDGTIYEVARLPELTAVFDFALNAVTPIPLVHPDTGAPLGADTNLQTVFLNILAVVRQLQKGA